MELEGTILSKVSQNNTYICMWNVIKLNKQKQRVEWQFAGIGILENMDRSKDIKLQSYNQYVL